MRIAALLLLLSTAFALASDPDPYEVAAKQNADALAKLDYMKGAWEATTTYLDPEAKEWKVLPPEPGTDPTVRVTDDDRVSALSISIPGKTAYYGTLSYDVFQGTYRIAFIDDTVGLLDIFEGGFEGSKLTLTNLSAGTFFLQGDQKMFSRLQLLPQGDGWVLTADLTADQGKTWQPAFKLEATRNKGLASN